MTDKTEVLARWLEELDKNTIKYDNFEGRWYTDWKAITTALLEKLEPVREALKRHGFCNTGPRNDQACPLCVALTTLSTLLGEKA